MSDKSKLCNACGIWAPDGVRVREPDGTTWWVHNNETCTEGAEIIESVPVTEDEVFWVEVSDE